jgi:hypothetical protein
MRSSSVPHVEDVEDVEDGVDVALMGDTDSLFIKMPANEKQRNLLKEPASLLAMIQREEHCHSCGLEKPTQRCGRCQVQRYCCRECQVDDWTDHACAVLVQYVATLLQAKPSTTTTKNQNDDRQDKKDQADDNLISDLSASDFLVPLSTSSFPRSCSISARPSSSATITTSSSSFADVPRGVLAQWRIEEKESNEWLSSLYSQLIIADCGATTSIEEKDTHC